jgi:hypothetical protein
VILRWRLLVRASDCSAGVQNADHVPACATVAAVEASYSLVKFVSVQKALDHMNLHCILFSEQEVAVTK